MEKNIELLSERIVNHSLKLKDGDKVLITCQTMQPKDLVKFIIKSIFKVGAIPFVRFIDPEIEVLQTENTSDKRIEQIKKNLEFDVQNFDAFINIRYTTNDFEMLDISSDIKKKIGIATSDSDYIKINKRNWILLNYPSNLDAYKAHMTTHKFYEYAFSAMNLDYLDLESRVEPLKKLMEKTDKVHIISPNTDITFSIKGMNIIPCLGRSNIPDGEIFTAPIKDSVNGKITYNVSSPYQGRMYNNVSLEFENGRIVKASSDSNSTELQNIFNTDMGAKYIGEFSLGLNPLILNPMGDILFDEKIIGSLHFTPGKAYDEASNGNDSNIHWDLVLIQRKEYGGGELYFDDVLIRKDGLFVLPELIHLNYDLK